MRILANGLDPPTRQFPEYTLSRAALIEGVPELAGCWKTRRPIVSLKSGKANGQVQVRALASDRAVYAHQARGALSVKVNAAS
jgi:hypothetical protein